MQETIELRSDMSEPQLDLVMEMLAAVEHVPGVIVEIGSWKCGTSGVIASMTQKNVYAFDLFGGLPYGSGTLFDHFGEVEFERIKENVKCFPHLHLVRGRHEETVPKWAEGKSPISLLIMDSDHYSSHVVSMKHLWPLLSQDGVIIFHDWHFVEVQQAVQETLNVDDVLFLSGRDLHGMGILRKL